MLLPTTIASIEDWLYADALPLFDINPESLDLAKRVAFEGWKARAVEGGQEVPSDLSYGCKFSSLFVRVLFGGDIRGNEDHQFNSFDDLIVDLSSGAADVRGLVSRGVDPYRHDREFFGNDEHLEAMLSCMPRVGAWVSKFTQAMVDQRIGHPDPFLNNLLNYLSDVLTISPGWLSDGVLSRGTPPSFAATSEAIKVLRVLYESDTYSDSFVPGKIILGPLVEGGISIEATSTDSASKLLVSLFNDGTSNIEEMSSRVWEDVDIPLDQFLASITGQPDVRRHLTPL